MAPLRSRSIVWMYSCLPSGDHDSRTRSPFSFPVSTSTIVAGGDSVSFDASIVAIAMLSAKKTNIRTSALEAGTWDLEPGTSFAKLPRIGHGRESAVDDLTSELGMSELNVDVGECEIGGDQRGVATRRIPPGGDGRRTVAGGGVRPSQRERERRIVPARCLRRLECGNRRRVVAPHEGVDSAEYRISRGIARLAADDVD